MNEQTEKDFHKELFWLAQWFSLEAGEKIRFPDEDSETIFKEVCAHWAQKDILSFLDELEKQYGEKVKTVLELVVAENIRAEWVEIAGQEKTQTSDDLMRLLWEPLAKEGFEYTADTTPGKVQLKCTHCPMVAIGRTESERKWLYSLVCMGDPFIVEGFNQKMQFQRTKTLMEGHDCCDHTYINGDT